MFGFVFSFVLSSVYQTDLCNIFAKLAGFWNFFKSFFLWCFVFLLCLKYIKPIFATSLHRQAAGPDFALKFQICETFVPRRRTIRCGRSRSRIDSGGTPLFCGVLCFCCVYSIANWPLQLLCKNWGDWKNVCIFNLLPLHILGWYYCEAVLKCIHNVAEAQSIKA